MKRRILWLLLCMLLCTMMAACAGGKRPSCRRPEVQTQPETPEPTQETEPSQAPEEPDQAVSAHGSAAYIHGRTLVVSIFADDAATHWDETTDAADIDQTQEHLRIATEWLTDAVKPYGVTAEFFYDWKENPRSAVQRQIHRDAGACRRLHVRCAGRLYSGEHPHRGAEACV